MSPSAHNYHDLEQDLQEKWDSISYSFSDQYKILRNCLPTPPQTQSWPPVRHLLLPYKAKRLTGGRVGGQFTRISYQSLVFAISIFLHINSVHLSDEFEILFLDSLLRKQQSMKLCVVRFVRSWFKESKLKTKTKLTLSIQGWQFKELIKLWSFKCPQLNRDTCPIKLEIGMLVFLRSGENRSTRRKTLGAE